MSSHAELIHDAEVMSGREDGDCLLSDSAFWDGVFALLADNQRLRDLLQRVVAADDAKKAANASGQHASPISYWIPLEEAIDGAREALAGDAE